VDSGARIHRVSGTDPSGVAHRDHAVHGRRERVGRHWPRRGGGVERHRGGGQSVGGPAQDRQRHPLAHHVEIERQEHEDARVDPDGERVGEEAEALALREVAQGVVGAGEADRGEHQAADSGDDGEQPHGARVAVLLGFRGLRNVVRLGLQAGLGVEVGPRCGRGVGGGEVVGRRFGVGADQVRGDRHRVLLDRSCQGRRGMAGGSRSAPGVCPTRRVRTRRRPAVRAGCCPKARAAGAKLGAAPGRREPAEQARGEAPCAPCRPRHRAGATGNSGRFSPCCG
jgi:hypothetical protein